MLILIYNDYNSTEYIWPITANNREEAKRRILKEYPDMPKDTLEFGFHYQWNKKYQRLAN